MIFRPLEPKDQEWLKEFVCQRWGSDQMIVHGDSYWISSLPGFVAEQNGNCQGLVTYRLEQDACEIMSLDSLQEGAGIGTTLIEMVKRAALAAGCSRLYLSTTNDNINALRFYQRRGFLLAALRCEAVTESRKIKPEIPLLGDYGIPIRDEIEFEMWLNS